MRSGSFDSQRIVYEPLILARHRQMVPSWVTARRRAAVERQPATVFVLPPRMTWTSQLLKHQHAPEAQNDNDHPCTPGSAVALRRYSWRDGTTDGVQSHRA